MLGTHSTRWTWTGSLVDRLSRRATEVIRGKLYVVGGMIPLDGRASWVPESSTGYQPSNSYVLVDSEPLVVDTGAPYVRDQVLAGLAEVVEPGSPIQVFFTRAQPLCSGNLEPLVERYKVTSLFTGGTRNPFDSYDDIVATKKTRAQELVVLRSPAESRLELYHPALRLLATTWAYDPETKTVFTSDSFTHVTVPYRDSPRVLDRLEQDVTTVADIRGHLYATFWWLADADRAGIAESVRAFFAMHEVEIIAPATGCVISGADAVRHHVDMMLEVLRDGQEPSPGGKDTA